MSDEFSECLMLPLDLIKKLKPKAFYVNSYDLKQWNDKKSQLQTLMGNYNVAYRAWNEVSDFDGLKPFIGYAADVVTVEGDYTTYVNNGSVITVTFNTAPSTGDKVKAYGVY